MIGSQASSGLMQGEEGVAGTNMVGSDSGIGMEGHGSAGSEDGYIGEFSRDYINAEIFKLFDTDGSGKITKEDLDEVAK